jgi:PHD/YefM family antitoxin component YafN of YafNO toxin-antitoxin module
MNMKSIAINKYAALAGLMLLSVVGLVQNAYALSFAPNTEFLEAKTQQECEQKGGSWMEWYNEKYCTKAANTSGDEVTNFEECAAKVQILPAIYPPQCTYNGKTFIQEVDNFPTPPIKPIEPVMCTMDAKQCSDGSFVGRTGPNCEFICPGEKNLDKVTNFEECAEKVGIIALSYPAQCTYNGKTYIEEVDNFPTPPIKPIEPVMCTMDAKQCSDGSFVGRTGPNCEFICPGEGVIEPILPPTIINPIDLPDPFEGVVSEDDWENLSMKEIDEKLKKAGKQPIGFEKDPLYELTPQEIEKLTDDEWREIEKQIQEIFEDELPILPVPFPGDGENEDFLTFPDPFEGIISEDDWENLSMKEIDEKLKKAGKQPIGFEKDPLYELTPQEIEKLTDDEWKKIEKEMEKIFEEEFGELFNLEGDIDGDLEIIPLSASENFSDPFEGIISQSDWENLSMKDIDEKLKKAGAQPIGFSEDPLYELTPQEIDNLSEAQWEEIFKQFDALYQ